MYVYGIAPASELDALPKKGVEGAPVRTIEHAGLAALASELRGDSIAAPKEVRAHWSVLDEVCRTATVLPTRFGTAMESEQAVRDRLLAANADRLRELLGSLADHIQLNVSGDYDEGRLMREVVRDSPAITGLREKLRSLPEAAGYYDRIRLGELVAAEIQRRRAADTELALTTLAARAADVREEQVSRAETAFKLAFLVERSRQDAFTEAVDELAGTLGDRVSIRYVGPLPPYSFADVDLTAEEEAWA